MLFPESCEAEEAGERLLGGASGFGRTHEEVAGGIDAARPNGKGHESGVRVRHIVTVSVERRAGYCFRGP
jgi:hypothetical protein